MSLSEEFKSAYGPKKVNDSVLRLYFDNIRHYYDFDTRLLTTVFTSGSTNGAVSTIPFSQLDRDTLVTMRDRLVELGGKPPELAAEAPVVQKQRGLNP